MRKILILCSLILVYLGAEEVSIQTKNTVLREKPSFLGKKITTLKYADTVTLNNKQKGWVNVSLIETKQKGWLHQSAITTKKIVLSQSKEDVETLASSGEIVMSGKGFSKKVEDEYKQNNKKLRYDLVDKIEQHNVSTDQVVSFIKVGKLSSAGSAL